ncbi:response regulator [Microvirga sp. 2MCAF38]|uniref:response regulator n=1 Tax=Microvirga sp. 2MCAF38 TaxID=3232989 RepID=UPI003F99632D
MFNPERLSSTDSYTILCVDDDARTRADVAEVLGSAGFLVQEAGDGAAALEILKHSRPDLILCDISMPIVGGYELLRLVRERHPSLNDVPFMFLSVLSDRKGIIEGKHVGADDYLIKPVDYDVLLATVRARIDQVGRIKRSVVSELERESQFILASTILDAQGAFDSMARTLDGMAKGVIFLDSDGHLQQMNRSATEILEKNSGLIASANRLSSTSKETTRALRQAIANAPNQSSRTTTLSIERENGRPLIVHICSLGTRETRNLPSVVILVIDPDDRPRPAPSLTARMYDLTNAETRLAVALADGKRLDEIANEFSVAQTTISFHLQNLFRKTKTSRQTDLVALLLRGALALRVDEPLAQRKFGGMDVSQVK